MDGQPNAFRSRGYQMLSDRWITKCYQMEKQSNVVRSMDNQMLPDRWITKCN